MFARFTAAAILALPVFAAASAIPRDAPSNQCNTGAVQCCNSVQQVGLHVYGITIVLIPIYIGK